MLPGAAISFGKRCKDLYSPLWKEHGMGMRRQMRRVCVYCGSSAGTHPGHATAAAAFGKMLAGRGIGLVYGGGNVGLMGVLADAVLEEGGEVIGVIPEALLKKELGHRGVTDLRVTGSMHERKQLMADLSDGFVALPGGVGTLEELFETWTWLQLSFHEKPVGVWNAGGFYDWLVDLLPHLVGQGFLRQKHADVLLVDSDPAALLERMALFEAPEVEKWVDRPAPEER